MRYTPAFEDVENIRHVPLGHSMCIAGYLDCPVGPTDHWHCGNCGGISGHQGHYSKLPGQTEWQFNCPVEASPDDWAPVPGLDG